MVGALCALIVLCRLLFCCCWCYVVCFFGLMVFDGCRSVFVASCVFLLLVSGDAFGVVWVPLVVVCVFCRCLLRVGC